MLLSIRTCQYGCALLKSEIQNCRQEAVFISFFNVKMTHLTIGHDGDYRMRQSYCFHVEWECCYVWGHVIWMVFDRNRKFEMTHQLGGCFSMKTMQVCICCRLCKHWLILLKFSMVYSIIGNENGAREKRTIYFLFSFFTLSGHLEQTVYFNFL